MITILKTQKFARKSPNLNGKFSIVAKNRKLNGISALKNKTPSIIKIQMTTAFKLKIIIQISIHMIKMKRSANGKYRKNKQLFNTIHRH